ncbi:MAG: pyridoxal 5'-phosphate synthase glutaminase subunit PdxT [Dehalococcoidia bacterium]|nr:pyridoxal 5'-phosphate synthase glutaminase subunit PdxT [Dehalococcoidia bacterium]
MTEIGLLALQGDFAEHAAAFQRLGASTREVRKASELDGVDALVIPGGESTTICRLMAAFDLLEPLRRFAADRPIWGTCAGMIVLARRASDLDLPAVEVMDIGVRRNAFGRQLDSFEAAVDIPALGSEPFHAVFIRAPVVDEVGPGVDVLARLPDGRAVAVQQGKLLATAFHPELTDDDRVHRHFLAMARPEAQQGVK